MENESYLPVFPRIIEKNATIIDINENQDRPIEKTNDSDSFLKRHKKKLVILLVIVIIIIVIIIYIYYIQIPKKKKLVTENKNNELQEETVNINDIINLRNKRKQQKVDNIFEEHTAFVIIEQTNSSLFNEPNQSSSKIEILEDNIEVDNELASELEKEINGKIIDKYKSNEEIKDNDEQNKQNNIQSNEFTKFKELNFSNKEGLNNKNNY
jgi:cell division protein FtsI/penicillin-binding protein 2